MKSREAKEEIAVLFLSLTPWIGLPVIAYLNLSQAIEASVTNTGFLLLLALQLKNHIRQMRIEHEKLILSEKKLVNWNENLQKEVERRTKELEKLNEQKTNTFVNLAHETKTPLTLISNYLDEYISKKGTSEELNVVKKNIDKLSTDIVNFFDLERFNKGFAIYNHDQICNFSEILSDDLALFKRYAENRNIFLHADIRDGLFVKADPVAINRIIINIIENAIKFSDDDCEIEVSLQEHDDKVIFSVKDCGMGIPPQMQSKVFEPYYQITNHKQSIQGMGLGLPIVKKVVEDIKGEVKIESNPKKDTGTKMIVILNKHALAENEIVSANLSPYSATPVIEDVSIEEQPFDEKKETILIVEDNVSMVNYLAKKLYDTYNVYTALNGNEALKKLKALEAIPDLILSDVMMDKVDGYAFAKIISNDPHYSHIPFMFLSAKAGKSDKLKGLRLGAIDYVQKPFSVNVLKQKIESILQNAKRQRSAVVNKALNVFNKPEPKAAPQTANRFEPNCELYHLTSREKDIAKLVCEGRRYKEIGETLFIAERTVTKHVQNIFEKVGVTNKIALINKLEN